MNGVSALLLFDLGATRSFVSLAPIKRFCDAPRELDYPLEVEIAGDRLINESIESLLTLYFGDISRLVSD